MTDRENKVEIRAVQLVPRIAQHHAIGYAVTLGSNRGLMLVSSMAASDNIDGFCLIMPDFLSSW